MSTSTRSRRAPGRDRSRLAAVVLALAAAACADGGVGPEPREPQQLLVVSTRGDNGQGEWAGLGKDIYRMNVDGSGAENLTNQLASRYRALDLSPDGRKVVFNSDRDGCYNLWAMNTDGTGLVQLTGLIGFSQERCNYTPLWSPDGTKIAFMSSRDRVWGTYVMNADGSNPHRVSADLDGEYVYSYPAGWTPDGRVVVEHVRSVDGAWVARTYVVKADGTGLAPLFARDGDTAPAWSPDGSKVAFISDRDGKPKLFVMNANGSGVRRLSDLPGTDVSKTVGSVWDNDYEPWSPDGRQIAFMNYDGAGDVGVYVVNADGTGLRRVTPPELAVNGHMFNGWSPDGTRIAFTSDAAGLMDVYLVNPDGTDLVRITPDGSHESHAVWLPRR
ncbi:MAG TPA: hypothetical protein VFQ45_10450 [Longimicrobium sp.]|nr:hypothetical protein [Longimicrobium sp.]